MLEPATNYGVDTATKLRQTVDSLAPLAETSHDLAKQTDLLHKLAIRLIETCEKECDAKSSDAWNARDVTRARKSMDETRSQAVEQLKQVRYFWHQAHWLTERFPEAKLRDVGRAGQAGRPGRGRGQRLEPDPWPLRGRGP